MAAWRSAAPLNRPRLSRRRVSLAKNLSAALSQEGEASHASTSLGSCRERISSEMPWNVLSACVTTSLRRDYSDEVERIQI